MFRLLGLLGGLSVATDLGTGAPLEESLRRCVLAVRLARAAGACERDVADTLYTSLLQHLGCTAYAHELARAWGDDVEVIRLSFLTDFSRPTDVWGTWVTGLAGVTGTSRARALATTVAAGRRADAEGPPATCEVAREAARMLALPASVQAALFHGLARWDGSGYPASRGSEIPLATRYMQVASTAVMLLAHTGPEAAIRGTRQRAGSQLDPQITQVLLDQADDLLAGIEDLDAHQEVLDSEPDPVALVDPGRLVEVARTLGHLVDLKSPWFQGHSTAVADLAETAGHRLGLESQTVALRVAGHLHDLGRVGVSGRIWAKPGPLSRSEHDQVRLHAHHGERILARVPELSQVATLVGQHHERCDGSGYHRGLQAPQLPLPSRVLATAETFRTALEARPHRAALTPARAADRLRAEVTAGRLDPDAVAAVLEVAGQGRASPSRPAGLTPRQGEVLRLVATGMSNREIADRLGISRRTAEHHVQDVYTRLGFSTRAGAALFAMEHGLVEPG